MLPLAHQTRGHVQVAGEHRLARMLPQPEITDPLRHHVLDRRQTHLVEGLHGPLRHTLATGLARASFWEAHASDVFNARQVKILNRLLDGFEGKLTSSKWARMNRCSQDTANRDIRDLIDRGILVRGPAGGRSTSYELPTARV